MSRRQRYRNVYMSWLFLMYGSAVLGMGLVIASNWYGPVSAQTLNRSSTVLFIFALVLMLGLPIWLSDVHLEAEKIHILDIDDDYPKERTK